MHRRVRADRRKAALEAVLNVAEDSMLTAFYRKARLICVKSAEVVRPTVDAKHRRESVVVMTRKTSKGSATAVTEQRQIVVQTRRGKARPEDRIPVASLQVPDLWHSFDALDRVASEIRQDNHTQNVVIDGRAKTLERVRMIAEQTWGLAGDMKRCLQDTVGPAVSETLLVLDALKAEAGIRKLEPEDIQRAIAELEKALEDGQK